MEVESDRSRSGQAPIAREGDTLGEGEEALRVGDGMLLEIGVKSAVLVAGCAMCKCVKVFGSYCVLCLRSLQPRLQQEKFMLAVHVRF